MKDVAREARVSIQTVSAVINDKPGITDSTRDRVQAAILDLGYRPYSVARSLRTRKTRTIALIISDIANPSFATMASAAEEVAHSFGYSLVVFNTHDDPAREVNCIQTVIERWIDGVLFVAAQDQVEGLEGLRRAGIATVALDRIPAGYTGPSVTLDNIRAGQMAVEYLVGLGHTQIAQIAGPTRLRLARERVEGAHRALALHGLQPGTVVNNNGNWECAAGYAAMQQILAEGPRPSAVFAANDRMAIGAMRAIFEAGLRVPDDISMVGLDDFEVSEYHNPPLTTVKQSFGELATVGVRLLLDLLAGNVPDATRVVVQPTLVIRQSAVVVRNRGQGAPSPAARPVVGNENQLRD